MKKPVLSDLTLREKIGQMGVYMSEVCQQKLKENAPDLELIGGVWIIGALDMTVVNMSFNVTDEIMPAKYSWLFMDALNKKTKIPAIGCMDATRGIQSQFYDTSLVMDPMTVGATASEGLAYKLGRAKANELKCAGARWLWGPEEDLSSRFASIALGRKYSDDPDLVIKLGSAESKGIQDAGVVATSKHFPGDDGMEYRDSHTSESIMRLPVDEWKKTQGRVFRGLFDSGVYSVMVGHQSFPACDNRKINGQYIPSTISYNVVTKLLKQEMGFEGVVITDAIRMESLAAMFNGNLNEVAIACINAGCDVILGAMPDFIDAVEQAVMNGEVLEERIDDACQRILDMKEKTGLFENPMEEMNLDNVVAETAAVNQEIAEKALSLVCDKNNLLPLPLGKYKKVAIIYSGYSEEVFESLKYMKDELLKHSIEEVDIIKCEKMYCKEKAEELSASHDLMLYVGHVTCGNPYGVAGFQQEKYYAFYHMTNGNQIGKRLAVSLGSPFLYFDYYAGFECFVNAYNATEMTQRSFVKALYGELPFEGKHPFRLIPKGLEVDY